MIWFLAPTKPLASQQFDVLRAQIPSVQSKFICGDDNVDAWSDQGVWDGVLLNVRIVVATYQILLDAVSHSFIQLASLSLIVIDEGECFLCFCD
jgi:ERCC4-related helicase